MIDSDSENTSIAPEVYQSKIEANQAIALVRDLIGFERVKILEILENRSIVVEYAYQKFAIIESMDSLDSSAFNSSDPLRKKYGSDLCYIRQPFGYPNPDPETPPEFMEVAMFNEIRNKEYSHMGLKDINDQSARDEIMYAIQYLDGHKQKEYFEWAKQYKETSAYKMKQAELELNSKYEPREFFKNIKKVLSVDNLEKYASLAAENNPSVALEFLGQYKTMPWTYEIAFKAAEVAPMSALIHADQFIDMPWAEDILKKAAPLAFEKSPVIIAKYAINLESFLWTQELISKAVEIVLEVLNKQAEKNPKYVLSIADGLKTFPWALAMTEKAARTALEKDPKSLLKYSSQYKEMPWAEELIEKAAEKDPKNAMKYSPRYWDMPWAKRVLLKVAEQDPQAGLNIVDVKEKAKIRERFKRPIDRLFEEYIPPEPEPFTISWDSEIIERAMRSAAEKDPTLALSRMVVASMRELPWAKEVSNKAHDTITERLRVMAEIDPQKALEKLRYNTYLSDRTRVDLQAKAEERLEQIRNEKKLAEMPRALRFIFKAKSKLDRLGKKSK